MDLTNVRVTASKAGNWVVAPGDIFRLTVNKGRTDETVIEEEITHSGTITDIQSIRGTTPDGRDYLGGLFIFKKD